MSKKVMVVDDSGSFRLVVRLALHKAGYQVVEAQDGQDALDKLDAERPSLIVCDLNMPRLDGLAFARHVKASPIHKFRPLIMLTTESQLATKAEGKAAGVSAWMTKPFQPSHLVDAVSRLCP